MIKRRFWVRSASPQLAEGMTSGWTIKGLMGNYPGYMGQISAYHSVLSAGHMPHEINAHDEEELIVMLSGRLDVLTPARSHRIGPGGFVHLPPRDLHAVRSAGPESTGFLVFKWTWQNAARTRPEATPFLFDGDGFDRLTDQGGIQRRRVCESQPLANGGRLVVETIRLAPHVGYSAHSHDHDLMLILLRGHMHALGHITCGPAIVYYPAGTPHGLAPLSPDPIEMIAFEFHRPPLTHPSSA